ncbi:MAG: hypothetical protein J6Q78_04795 [Clostridia bacterium]|nr:hypothetical protein [Clostridia bacterium]
MYEYEYTPEKTDKSKKAAICLIIGASVLLLTVSLINGIAFKGVFQLVSFFIFGLAILFVTRSMKNFTYRITDNSDRGLDLTVTEVQGKSRITVCRVALSGISEATVCNRRELKKQKAEIRHEKKKFYCYTADIMEETVIVVHAVECGEPVVIILSYDEELYSILQK